MSGRSVRSTSPTSYSPRLSIDGRHLSSFPLPFSSHNSSSSSSSDRPSEAATLAMSDDEVATTATTPTPPFSSSIVSLQPPPPPPPLTQHNHSFPAREDCWSERATHVLIEEWGSHYLRLNRGNLTQKHWQQIADAINDSHVSQLPRTDVQCKNRIDTVKKKYKIEKSKDLKSDSRYVSSWPFFQALDSLIGSNYYKTKHSPPPSPVTRQKTSRVLPPPPSSVPVAPRSKRPISDEALFRRNFSAMAAAAAAVEAEEQEGRGESEPEDTVMKNDDEEGYIGRLAAAIERVGEIYARVEAAKQKQMVELEKQRMQFVKDMEVQRMKWFVDSQLQLHKIKRSKHRTSEADSYSKT